MMHRVFSHTGVRWITLGWAAFIGENLVLSHNRDAIIEQFGRSVYFNTYGTLSTAATASIVYGYWRHGRRQGPLLPTIKSKLAAHTASKKLVATACRIRSTPVAVASAAILQFIGLGLLSQLMPRVQIPFEYSYVTKHEMSQTESESTKNQPSLLVPPKAENGQTSATLMTKQWIFRCPFDFSKNEESSNVSDGDDELYTGVYRITRHPGLWGLGLFGLGSAFLRPFITEILFFSLPALFALIGGAHQDYRHRRSVGGYLSPTDDAKTSNFPFLALILGNQSWTVMLQELKHGNILTTAVGIACLRANAWRVLR